MSTQGHKAGGFLWSKAALKGGGKRAIPIEQINPYTSEVVGTFRSLTQAADVSNIRLPAISVALKTQTEAGGFYWRKVGDNTTPVPSMETQRLGYVAAEDINAKQGVQCRSDSSPG
jgi:hypothetical protein